MLATMSLLVTLSAAAALAVTKTGTLGADRIVGTDGPDTLKGLAGDDDIFGLAGNDTLKGGTGGDLLKGGRGSDTLSGQIGPDRAFGNKGADDIFGGDGDDELSGGFGNDLIVAFNDNDRDFVKCGLGANDEARVDLNDVVDGEPVESLLEAAGGVGAVTTCETIVVLVADDLTVTIELGLLDDEEVALLEDLDTL